MKLSDLSLHDFIGVLGSGTPTPGGGSVAALCGALGAALSLMVARLTLGKDQFQDAREGMEEIQQAAEELAARFLTLVQADSDAYDGVLSALGLPRETDEQKTLRKASLREATRTATMVPLETLHASEKLMRMASRVVFQGNPAALTDASAALHLARTAAVVASCNVRINLPGLGDETAVTAYRREAGEVLQRIDALLQEADSYVNAHLL